MKGRPKRDYEKVTLYPELPKDLWVNVRKKVSSETAISNLTITQTLIYVFEKFLKGDL